MPQRPLVISEHARKTMNLRGVCKDDIFDILDNPQRISETYRGRTLYCKDNLIVVLGLGKRFDTVVTVLLNHPGVWTNEQVRGRKKNSR
jgi:hypothetical protein